MKVKILSAICKGFQALPVTITVTCEQGQGLKISGLITQTIHRDLSRIQLAIINCGLGFKDKKIHIEVEPAIYENAEPLMLPLAIGMIISSEQFPISKLLAKYLIAGGLGVTGNFHGFEAMHLVCKLASQKNVRGIILPSADNMISDFDYSVPLFQFKNLNTLVRMFKEDRSLKKIELPQILFEQLNFN